MSWEIMRIIDVIYPWGLLKRYKKTLNEIMHTHLIYNKLYDKEGHSITFRNGWNAHITHIMNIVNKNLDYKDWHECK